MRTLKHVILATFSAIFILVSCQKETSSLTTSTLGVKIQASNTSFSLLKSAATITNSFVWDSCFMVVSKLEFEAERRDSLSSKDSMKFHEEWNGPKRINLLEPSSLIGDVTLQPGTYNELSLKIVSYKADAGNNPVFYLSGHYTNSSGLTIPIIISVNEDFWFKIEKESSGFDASANVTTLVNLNLSLLMSGFLSSELEAATLTNGNLVINSNSNAVLYQKFLLQLSKCEETEIEHGQENESRHGHGKDSSH